MAESVENDAKEQHGSEKSLSPSASDGSLSSESTISMPPAPDGGYGWIIILSAFLTSVISDGLAFSCGVLYSELLAVFEESKSITSWIPSLFLGVPMIAGPLAGALATKYGCRKVLMLGGVVTSVGIFASAFANSVALLCFLFGIVAGTGLSMGYVTSVVMVAFYFEKRRALATGLAVCGSGIGTFVFAPLFEYLIEEYTWRGSLIILSGITLNLVVCGALLRPLEFTAAEEWRRNLEAFEKISRTMSKASLPESRNSRRESQANSSDEDSELEEICQQLSNSQVILPTFLTDQKKQIPDEIFEEISKNRGQASQILKNYFRNRGSSEMNITENPFQDMLMVTSNDNIVCVKEVPKQRQKVHSKNKATHKIQQYVPIYRKDLFYRGNVMKFSDIHYRSTSCPELYRGSFDDLIDDEDFLCPLPKLLRLSKHMKKFFKTMFDPSIIKNPLFLLFASSNFMLYFWYDVPYVFSVDHAKELGFSDETASYLLSIIGVVNTFGQIFYGYIGDKDINIPLLYGLSISASGLAMFFYPLFNNYIILALICGTYGFFISANYVLSTMLLVEFLGMDKLTNAYGLTMLIQGIGNMVGPPFAGFLYDTSGSYDNSFYCSGIFIILAGFLLTTSAIYKGIRRVCSSRDVRNRKPADCGNGLDIARVTFLKKDIEIIV